MKNLSKEIETLRSSKNSHYLLDEMWAYKPFARKMQELDVSYEESQEQLPMLSRFYESMKYCDTSCPGLEACDSPMPHYVCQLSRNDLNQLELTTGPCVLFAKAEAIRSNMIFHDVPDEWMESNEQPSLRSKELFQTAGAVISPETKKKWVLVNGDPGSGKSYVSFLVAKFLAAPPFNQTVAFIDVRKRFDELKGEAIKDRPSFERDMKKLTDVDILFLDAFGDEYKNDYTRDQVLMPLLSARSNRKAPTFFLSSFTLDEIRQLYATSMNAKILAKKMAKLIEANLLKRVVITERFDI